MSSQEVDGVDPSVRSGKHAFAFRGCRYTVKAKGGTKELLKGIDGTVQSGEVLAVMGPSGAGKTTLLSLLTLVKGSGDPVGSVTLNGKDLTPTLFRKYCALVTQQDWHWTFLTCRESLEYAADMYLSGSKDEKQAKVDDLIKEMGLQSCEHTRCGNQFISGLSNGQRRRLSLALALIKEPLLLFLDEPTSGLDAAAAGSIMKFLKELAAKRDIIIVCTIHQPSSLVFEGFDGTMVLANGEIAYSGPASEVVSYVDSIGMPMPENTNPAEYLLDLVNREFTNPKMVDKVMASWKERAPVQAPVADLPLPEREHKTSLVGQLSVLFRRHGLMMVRDPSLYLGRIVMFMISCAFFCFIYWEARKRVQEQALYRLWLILWTVGVPTNLGVIAVFVFNQEFIALKREIRDGMFSPFAYLFSNFVLQLPLMLIMGIAAIGISVYAISGFHGAHFLEYWITFSICLFVFEGMAQMLSVVFDNPLIGMLAYMGNWFNSFLFSGLVVAREDVIWPFRAFNYVMPLKFAVAGLTKIEYNSDVTFDGAAVDLSHPKGYVCQGLDELLCYGYTGSQVLDTLGNSYQSLGSDTDVFIECLCMLGVAAFFKLNFFLVFWIKTTSMKTPAKP
eukprot:CAMPEP_0184298722 /NCGR_PEP_ID=MMETSP1049-20130417/9474_1 /TAXON_ID=77928 /ORGANISM="Proteomonas sulcata, Strain CCMP704" /LENGTH=616 /DNA_ID=CAMNT_0026608939 /DNA_START=77 /DNA_END=1927 /DNA_ORIENTATION=+